MLSEEEKKAVRNLENLSEFGLSATLNQADLDKMKTVLNIITKLQKEADILKNHIHYKKCKKCGKEFRTKRNDAKYCNECKKDNNKEWYKNLTDEQKIKRREQAKISMRKLRERRKTT